MGFRGLVLGAVFCLAAHASAAGRVTVESELLSSLAFMKGVYGSTYAPTAWKKKYAGWELETEYARAASRAVPGMSVTQARRALMDFVYSMKDYHVSISFQATAVSTLPMVIKGAGSKHFLAWIDRAKLTETSFPFSVGDEVVSFGTRANGEPIPATEAVSALQAEITENVALTDRSLAELNLTRRRASRGLQAPQGPVTLGIRPKGSNQVSYHQLIWEHTREQIDGFPGNGTRKAVKKSLLNPMMVADVDFAAAGENPHLIGGRRSFTPALGTKVWETAEADPFHAYIYIGEGGKLYGYVRVPSYVPADANAAVASFAKIIARFEATTQALVIDQVNNPGGSVFYLYALASMLSDQPLRTPRHEMSVTQADVLEAIDLISKLESVKDDAGARAAMGETIGGYPASYEVAQFILEYARFLVSEWKAGRKFTRPYWIAGVDHINPNPIHYTKPILMLTNALDFSGGDFFPAILQDNKRITILGTRTAGAGGYVNDVPYPNLLGVASFRITQSIATRANDEPIENLGVKPDVEYAISEKDYAGNFADYVRAIHEAVGRFSK